MDKKRINNKEITAVVRVKCFLFNPCFNLGKHNGFFHLVFHQMESLCVTSKVIDIHKIDGTVYVETQNSLYQLDGTKKIYHLDDVIRYLKDKRYSSKKFYDCCVANMMPTEMGWRVF